MKKGEESGRRKENVNHMKRQKFVFTEDEAAEV